MYDRGAVLAERATSMPARTEPVICTIDGIGVRDQVAAGVPVTADHVEHARRQELRCDLCHQQRRRGVVSDGLSATVLPAAMARPERPPAAAKGARRVRPGIRPGILYPAGHACRDDRMVLPVRPTHT